MCQVTYLHILLLCAKLHIHTSLQCANFLQIYISLPCAKLHIYILLSCAKLYFCREPNHILTVFQTILFACATNSAFLYRHVTVVAYLHAHSTRAAHVTFVENPWATECLCMRVCIFACMYVTETLCVLTAYVCENFCLFSWLLSLLHFLT